VRMWRFSDCDEERTSLHLSQWNFMPLEKQQGLRYVWNYTNSVGDP
jgi:hypothetical protein